MTVSHTCHWFLRFVVAAAIVFTAQRASADVIYDEASDGDLSDDRFAPSVLELGMHENIVRGSVGPASEDDLFTFTLPEGMYLTRVVLLEYSSSANTSFLGVQQSDVYASGFDHWGYVSFGHGDLGDDLLSRMASSRNQFETPLGPGSYTWWIDEYTQLETYSLCFDIVPEPTSAMLILTAAGFLGRTHRRRRYIR